MRKTFIFIVSLSLLLASISVSHAADTLGGYWAANPKYYTGSMASAYKTACTNGVSSWNSELSTIGKSIRIQQATSATSADVLASASSYGDNGWEGRTSSIVSGGKFLSSNVYLNQYYCDSYSAAKKRAVACHEFGHVLGLADISALSKRIMYYSAGYIYDKYSINTPQTSDRNVLKTIY